MNRSYRAPSASLIAEAESPLMLSSELPELPGGNGVIELPPIPMKKDEYAPPSVSIEEGPDDILMASGDGDLTEGGWGDGTDIEMPPIPMG